MPLPSDCQLSLMPDIPLDNFRGHLVPYTARIISGAPKMTAPKLPAQLWKLPKQHLCRHRLERAHNPSGRPLWGRLHKQVHVVRHQLQLDNLQTMGESNLTKNLSQPPLDSSHQTSRPTDRPESTSAWRFFLFTSARSCLKDNFLFCTGVATTFPPETARFRTVPSLTSASSARGLGILTARLLPHFRTRTCIGGPPFLFLQRRYRAQRPQSSVIWR